MKRCSACGGPFHPSTGHAWTESIQICGPCARDFVIWIKSREASMGRPWRRSNSQQSFSDAARNSVGARKVDEY